MDGEIPRQPAMALLGCGVFARDAYIPILQALQGTHITLRFVWSRSQAAAQDMVQRVQGFAPDVEARWGEAGLEHILASPLVQCCAIVLPILSQPGIVMRALRAGKHVLQEKPVAGSVEVGLQTMHSYQALQQDLLEEEEEATASASPSPPIWAVAENYRFEPAFDEAGKLVRSLGTMVAVSVSIEVPMTKSNKYFDCEWRRDPSLKGAFILDCGVHFVAGLRVMTGCDIKLVTAIATHRDPTVPAPDTLTTLIRFDNGCSGTMVITYASSVSKACWRVVCSRGTVVVERGVKEGKFGYVVTLRPREEGGYQQQQPSSSQFFPFSGLEEEWLAFVADVVHRSRSSSNSGRRRSADLRSSPREALKDLAIVEAALASGLHADAPVSVKPASIL
jgi:predicted dehydrogenase